jgi:hypothetical protein
MHRQHQKQLQAADTEKLFTATMNVIGSATDTKSRTAGRRLKQCFISIYSYIKTAETTPTMTMERPLLQFFFSLFNSHCPYLYL